MQEFNLRLKLGYTCHIYIQVVHWKQQAINHQYDDMDTYFSQPRHPQLSKVRLSYLYKHIKIQSRMIEFFSSKLGEPISNY